LQVAAGKTESGDVLVAVRDSGPGLAQQLSRISSRLSTQPNRTASAFLSICRSIIEAHGGRLWASGNAPRGAVFQFTLPGRSDIASRQ
jgi:K+-sensing histidine kinase KdpD